MWGAFAPCFLLGKIMKYIYIIPLLLLSLSNNTHSMQKLNIKQCEQEISKLRFKLSELDKNTSTFSKALNTSIFSKALHSDVGDQITNVLAYKAAEVATEKIIGKKKMENYKKLKKKHPVKMFIAESVGGQIIKYSFRGLLKWATGIDLT